VSDLTKARAIAAAATPGGVCAGPAPPQTTHRDTPQLSCPECGPDLDAFYMTYDPPMVLAMLDAVEAAGKWHEVSMIPGNFTVKDTFASERDFIDKLARFYDLIGDDRE